MLVASAPTDKTSPADKITNPDVIGTFHLSCNSESLQSICLEQHFHCAMDGALESGSAVDSACLTGCYCAFSCHGTPRECGF